ncbi:unnamed protein product [Caenorhabditis nigoni]
MASDDDVIYLSDDEENQRKADRQKAEDKKTVEDFQENHPVDFDKVREVFDKVFQYLNEDPIVKKILKALVPGVPYDLVGLCFAHFRKEILDHLMPDDVMSQPSQMGWLHMTYNRQPEISTIKFSHAFKACQIEEGDIEEYYKYRNGIDKRDGIKRHAGVLMNPIVRVIPKPKDTRNKGTQWEPEDEDQGECQVVEPAGPKRGKIRPSQCQAPTQPGSLESWIGRNQRGATPDIDGQGDDDGSPARLSSRPLSQEDRHRMSGGVATSPVVPMSARQIRSSTEREEGSQRSTGVSYHRSFSPPTAPSSPLAPCRQLTPSDAPATVQSSKNTQRSSRTGRFTARVAIRRALKPSDAIPRQGRGTQGCSRRRSSSHDAPSNPAPPRRRLRSADASTATRRGRRSSQDPPATSPANHRSGRRSTSRDAQSNTVPPRSPLTPSAAPIPAMQSRRSSREAHGPPATSSTNERASRRRSSSRNASPIPVPSRRRSASVPDAPQLSPVRSAPTASSEAAQKPKKARKRPAPYKAFGGRRRRYAKDPAKQSSGEEGPSTTAAPSGVRCQGKVATAKAGPTTTALSDRGRRKSPATDAPPMSRKRATVVTPNTAGAPQPKKRNTVI